MRIEDLVNRASLIASATGPRAVLGITGAPGAGKTTLAEALVARIPGAQHVPMDGFHLADVELDRLGRRGRKGAEDTFDAFGYVALLRRIRCAADEEIVYAPAFDRSLEQPVAGSIPILPGTQLVVTEGNYLLLQSGAWRAVRPLLDEAWWIDAADNERARRLVRRHQRFGKSYESAMSWVRDVDGANASLITSTRAAADLIVPSVLEGLSE